MYISDANNIIFPETTSALYVTYPEFNSAVTRIDADISAEIAARKAGDNDLLEKINNEKTARENGDADLLRKINIEIQDRKDAITTEKTEREDALENHRLSSTPHPNLTFDGIGGSLPTSRLSGTISDSQIGDVSSSKITGTFSTDKISGLQNYVETHSQGGISNQSLNENGYVKFDGGLIFQWGTTVEGYFSENRIMDIHFPISFPHKCFAISSSIWIHNDGWVDHWVQILSYDTSGFKCKTMADDDHSGAGADRGCSYIAVGY